jgi:hypothetical protein
VTVSSVLRRPADRLPPSTATIRRRRSAANPRVLSWLLSAGGVVVITVAFVVLVPDLWHWMVVPTSCAGVLLGVDVVDWLRGRLDVLQPRAMVALFGLHLCYLAPLLHVAWDYWPRYIQPAADWRASLAVLGVVNVAGLALYRAVLTLRTTPRSPTIEVDDSRFVLLGTLAALVGVVALVVVVIRFGGPAGYLHVITGGREALAGTGWLLLLAECWPTLVFAVVLVAGRRLFRRHVVMVLLLLAAFVLVQFVTGGLRGSRSNTVWPAMMAVGLVHLVVVRVRRRVLLAGALVLVAFMYVYGFYKSAGTQVLGLANQTTSAEALSQQTGRGLSLLLLDDFGRAGTQSLVIDRLARSGQLGWGTTYVGDLAKLVPEALVPRPPADKVVVGTDLLYGQSSYDAGLRSSRIYGLVGEGMLNFGLAGGALAFVPFAFGVRYADRIWLGAAEGHRLLPKMLAPALTAVAVVVLGSDFDNVLWLLVKQVLPLGAVVVLARRSAIPSRLTATSRSSTLTEPTGAPTTSAGSADSAGL